MATAKATVNLINKRARSPITISLSLPHAKGNGIADGKSQKGQQQQASVALSRSRPTDSWRTESRKRHYHVMRLTRTHFGGGH